MSARAVGSAVASERSTPYEESLFHVAGSRHRGSEMGATRWFIGVAVVHIGHLLAEFVFVIG